MFRTDFFTLKDAILVIGIQVRSKVLARELLRSADLRLVSNPAGDVVDQIVDDRSAIVRFDHGVIDDIEHIVSQQSVQVQPIDRDTGDLRQEN